jgi:hypothetical protein
MGEQPIAWFHVNRGGSRRNFWQAIAVEPGDDEMTIARKALTQLAQDVRQEQAEHEAGVVSLEEHRMERSES